MRHHQIIEPSPKEKQNWGEKVTQTKKKRLVPRKERPSVSQIIEIELTTEESHLIDSI